MPGSLESSRNSRKVTSPPIFPHSPGIMMLIFTAMIFSRCAKEPIPRGHRPNRNHSYDNLCPRQATTSTPGPFRKFGAPCHPVVMGRTSIYCLDGLPESHEGSRCIPEKSRPVVSLHLRKRCRRGHKFVWRRRYPRPPWFGCLCCVRILGYRRRQHVACHTF